VSETPRIEDCVVEAGPEGTAEFLRRLADDIEAARGEDVLIGIWNTGFGGPRKFCFQVVLTNEPADEAAEAAEVSP
jgi:hypothetical protein